MTSQSKYSPKGCKNLQLMLNSLLQTFLCFFYSVFIRLCSFSLILNSSDDLNQLLKQKVQLKSFDKAKLWLLKSNPAVFILAEDVGLDDSRG